MTANTVEENSRVTKTANEDWPILNELSNNRKFVVRHKKSNTNIEDLTMGLKDLGDREDEIVRQQNVQDEARMETVATVSARTHVAEEPRQEVFVEQIRHEEVPVKTEAYKNQDESMVMEATQDRTVQPQTKRVASTPQSYVQPETETAVEPVVAKQQVVSANKVPVVASVGQGKTKTVAQVKKANVLVKFMAKGMAHLYFEKTNKLLNPLRFVANNFNKVSMALLHLAVPFLMTWYLTKKVDFITLQMQKSPPFMIIVYDVLFYMACMFIWFSAQTVFSGLVGMVKKALVDVAKVGQEKN